MPADRSDTSADGPATFVNRFALRTSPEEFERVFAVTAAFMAAQPGFLNYSLMRAVDEPAAYVNIANWADVASFRQAVGHPDFRPHAAALRAISSSESHLCLVRQTVSLELR